MLLVDTLFLNSPGGQRLLFYLIEKLESEFANVYYLVDKRIEHRFLNIPTERKTICKASVSSRKIFYLNNKGRFQRIFCFANFAPPVRTSATVYTYYHNVLIFDLPGNSLKDRLIWRLKTSFLKAYIKNTDYYIFQSSYVESTFKEYFRLNALKSFVIPFYEPLFKQKNINLPRKKDDYLYISNTYPYKNHRILFEAWETVNKTYPEARLHVNVFADEDLSVLIEEYKVRGVNIVNHSFLEEQELISLHSSCAFVIYPSLLETLGLGIIEGVDAGCEVLVSDLPYAHAIISPKAFFNPFDAIDIAKTVIENNDFNSRRIKTKLKVENKIDELIALIGC